MSRHDYAVQLRALKTGSYKKHCIDPHLLQFSLAVQQLKQEFQLDDLNYFIKYCAAECDCAFAICTGLSVFLEKQKSKKKIQIALALGQAWLDHAKASLDHAKASLDRAKASHLITVLQYYTSLQQCVAMLTHLYDVQRCMSHADGMMVNLKCILETLQNYYAKEVIHDEWTHVFTIFLKEATEDLKLYQSQEYSHDAVRDRIKARIATILHGTPDQLGLHYCFSKVIPETQIQLLGGVNPVVFKVECSGMQAMILRLHKHPFSDAHLKAKEVSREHYPEFSGQIFLQGDGVGDTYCHYELSKFFQHGTLDDYIRRLHEFKKEGCFTLTDKRIFFNHFKQMLSLFVNLHNRCIYFSDTKPTNIFFNGDPLEKNTYLVISDIKSLALLGDNKKTTYDIAYTPDYAAPEVLNMKQSNGAAVNPYAQDIYALAMTFLEYLVGTTNPSILESYEPRDHFETVMYGLLKGMLHQHPLLRTAYADFLNDKVERLQNELFPPAGSTSTGYFNCQLFASRGMTEQPIESPQMRKC